MWPQGWRSDLLSLPHVPDEHVFTGRRGDVATLLPPPQGHVGDVGLLAPDDSEHRAGNIAQVLLGQPHDQQVVMNSVSIEKKTGDSKDYFSRNDATVNANVGPKLCDYTANNQLVVFFHKYIVNTSVLLLTLFHVILRRHTFQLLMVFSFNFAVACTDSQHTSWLYFRLSSKIEGINSIIEF